MKRNTVTLGLELACVEMVAWHRIAFATRSLAMIRNALAAEDEFVALVDELSRIRGEIRAVHPPIPTEID